jgi:cobalamin-dependent methionine synthase I
MSEQNGRKLTIIGELINNAYGRARSAFRSGDGRRYQDLARSQVEQGAEYLDVNLDGTPQLSVKLEEILAFLPDVVRAIQEVTTAPLCFDNPSWRYHQVALEHYDRQRSGPPILNSVAASREHLDEMIETVKAYDTLVVVMASEQFTADGSAQCLSPQDSYAAARRFIELLVTRADRRPDQILVDPGLAPVGADTYGLVNMGLDTMRLIRADPDLRDVHFVVGLSNFAWGTPRGVRERLEHAYLTIATAVGLDFAIANPEKDPRPAPADDLIVERLRLALEQGRPGAGEDQEMAGYRQAEGIIDICRDFESVEA